MRPMMREVSPERQLCFAVLEDALSRLAGANPENLEAPQMAEAREGARQWIAREGAAEEVMSFEWACDAIGIASGPLRRAALAGRITGQILTRFARLGYAPPRKGKAA